MTETLSPVLPDAIEHRAHRVLERANAAGLMLATAESCTGGLLASLLTDVEGASSAFERGPVRIKCLEVALEMIEKAL